MQLVSSREGGAKYFWGEIAPCDHLVQIYDEDDRFLDSLEGFVGAGLRAGDAIVVIATAAHRHALDKRLRALGMDLEHAASTDQYIPLDARDVLARFMVDGWPDDARFKALVKQLLVRAGRHGRPVRAFGEMVAIMWQQGHHAATVRLEHLWHRFCRDEGFALLCAYPKSGFTESAAESIREICAAHSGVVAA